MISCPVLSLRLQSGYGAPQARMQSSKRHFLRNLLSAYARARRCPFARVVQCPGPACASICLRAGYAVPRTGMANAGISLRVCYGISDTEFAAHAHSTLCPVLADIAQPRCIHAIPGTDIACGAISLRTPYTAPAY
eukprot:2870105-Rhodomonas_salina.1